MLGGIMDVTIEEITIDPKIVGRANGLDVVTVQTYADHMKNGAIFPPVEIVSNGDTLWLVDGQHRLKAAEELNLEKIEANVTHGDRRDALLMSFGTNEEHGDRRTNEDKRQKVMAMLEDKEWGKWSNREIAKRCKVAPSFVDKLRNHTALEGSIKTERTFIHHKTGQPTTMNTAEIGNANGDLVQTEIEPIISAEAVYEEKVKLERKEKKIQPIKPAVKDLWWQYHNLLLKANIISKTIAVNYEEYDIRVTLEDDSFLRESIGKAMDVNIDFIEGVKHGFQSKSA